MSTRSEDLATKVERSANALLAAVEASTPEQWAAPCSDGEWSQGFAAFHAAAAIAPIAQRVKEVAAGQPFPKMSMDEINADNAVQATEHAACTRSETIDLIKSSAPAAVSMVRSLTDDQLDRKVRLMEGMPETSVEMMVQLALVGHPAAHLATITGAR
jgi:phage terminase Nu1 subunit (DNA packaging protein)